MAGQLQSSVHLSPLPMGTTQGAQDCSGEDERGNVVTLL